MERQADGVGILPGEAAITRLIGAVLPEANDERRLRRRRMQLEAMAGLPSPDLGAGTLRPPPLAA